MVYFVNMVNELEGATRSHSPRVAHKRRKRKEKIIEIAMLLLAEGGLENVTVGHLAKELDYTPGALYRYFPSMDVLFAHMQLRAIGSLHTRIDEALGSLSGPDLSLQKIRTIARTYLGTSGKTTSHELSLIGQMLASPKILIDDPVASETAPRLVAILGMVQRLIDEAQDTGALRPGCARTRAVRLWAVLQGAAALGKLSRFDADLFSSQSIGEGLVADLLTAWGAAPTTKASKES